MKLAVICMDIVHIICCNEPDAMSFRYITQHTVDRLFLGQSVILYFEKEMILPEYRHILTNQGICPHIVPAQNRLWNLPCNTGRERNDPFMVLSQKFFINTWFIIISLDVSEGYELNQIAVAGFVLGKENQMIVSGTIHLCTFLALPRGKIDLTADDGMNALRLCLLIKPDSTIHHAVIGHSDRIHPELFRAPDQFFDAARTIKQAVFRMHMQVGKGHSAPPSRLFVNSHYTLVADAQNFSQISWYAVSSSSI